MALPLVPSTNITITNIKASYPTTNSNSIGSYRGKQRYTEATNSFDFHSSGEISFSDFAGTKEDAVFELVPNQQINLISSVYQYNGCAGAGLLGVSYRVINGAVYVYAGGYWSDYVQYGSSAFNTTYGGLAFASSVGVTSGLSSKVNIGGGGRDYNSIYLNNDWNGSTLTVQLYANCKGENWPGATRGYQLLSTFTPAIQPA